MSVLKFASSAGELRAVGESDTQCDIANFQSEICARPWQCAARRRNIFGARFLWYSKGCQIKGFPEEVRIPKFAIAVRKEGVVGNTLLKWILISPMRKTIAVRKSVPS